MNTVPPTKSVLTISRNQSSIRRSVPKPSIIIDSREKLPYFSKNKFKNWIETTSVMGLNTGDYSVVGYEHEIALERKSLPDIVGSLTSGRARFLREVERLKKFKLACICIEASREEIKSPYTFTTDIKVFPNSIAGSLDAIACKYPHIQIAYMSTRNLAEEFAASWLSKSYTYLWLSEKGYGNWLHDDDL